MFTTSISNGNSPCFWGAIWVIESVKKSAAVSIKVQTQREESSQCTVELEDATPEPDPEFVELEPEIESVEPESSPQLVVKPRVPLPSAKGRYSLRDRIVAPQCL